VDGMEEVVVFIDTVDVLVDDSIAGNSSPEQSFLEGFNSRFF
jgi:hypothetical protein